LAINPKNIKVMDANSKSTSFVYSVLWNEESNASMPLHPYVLDVAQRMKKDYKLILTDVQKAWN
tara:strand:- start:202 stop:393 length:192 start_codon:yes stop_codon:yes gene_type:complete